ncbi:hypothetical protein CEP50_10315 [Actinopolyspora mortivallis]|uniref:Uncharacterized protein n=1 Tax=Actinopolyspora mortivallis TaxID=33906 RepID=A0A2T0GWH6_ACTMO|nr:hypothetical protein CEP50_10315 [Actinopolyspora mortivallis]
MNQGIDRLSRPGDRHRSVAARSSATTREHVPRRCQDRRCPVRSTTRAGDGVVVRHGGRRCVVDNDG